MTLENQRLHLRISELEAQRDALLAAARELIESTDTTMDGPTEAAMVDGAPFDRLKALVMDQTANPPDVSQAVTVRYTNWQGVTSTRRIVPLAIRYASTEWHPQPQWVIDAHCCERGALRAFAVAGIHEWGVERKEVEQ